jgi:hypothetical protein
VLCSYVAANITTKERNGKFLHSGGFVSVVKSVVCKYLNFSAPKGNIPFRLHDMIVREPFKFMMALVNRGWMQADGLVVCAIAEAFPITNKQLRIEAPCNHRSCDDIDITIGICSLGYVKKLPTFARVSCPKELAMYLKRRNNSYRFKAVRSAPVSGRNPESTRQTTSWPLRSSMFERVC